MINQCSQITNKFKAALPYGIIANEDQNFDEQTPKLGFKQRNSPRQKESSQNLGAFLGNTPISMNASNNNPNMFLPMNFASQAMMIGSNGQFSDDVFDISPYWFAFETRIRKMVLAMVEPFVKRSLQGKDNIQDMQNLQQKFMRKIDECEIIVSKTARKNQQIDGQNKMIEQNEQQQRVRDFKKNTDIDKVIAAYQSLDGKFDIMESERQQFAQSIDNFSNLFKAQKEQIEQIQERIILDMSECQKQMKEEYDNSVSKIQGLETQIKIYSAKIETMVEKFKKVDSQTQYQKKLVDQMDIKVNLMDMHKLDITKFEERIKFLERQIEMIGKNSQRVEKSQQDTDGYLFKYLPFHIQNQIDETIKESVNNNFEILLKHSVFRKDQYNQLQENVEQLSKLKQFDKLNHPTPTVKQLDQEIEKYTQLLQSQRQTRHSTTIPPFNMNVLSPQAAISTQQTKIKDASSVGRKVKDSRKLRDGDGFQQSIQMNKVIKSKPIKQITMNKLALFHQNTMIPEFNESISPSNRGRKKQTEKQNLLPQQTNISAVKPQQSPSRLLLAKKNSSQNVNKKKSSNKLVDVQNFAVPINYRKNVDRQITKDSFQFLSEGTIKYSPLARTYDNGAQIPPKIDSKSSISEREDYKHKDNNNKSQSHSNSIVELNDQNKSSLKINLINIEETKVVKQRRPTIEVNQLTQNHLTDIQRLQQKMYSNLTLGQKQPSPYVEDIYSQHEPSDDEENDIIQGLPKNIGNDILIDNTESDEEEEDEQEENSDEDSSNDQAQIVLSQSILQKISKPYVFEQELEPQLQEKLRVFEESIKSLEQRFPFPTSYENLTSKMEKIEKIVRQSEDSFKLLQSELKNESLRQNKEVENINQLVSAQEKKIQRRKIEIDNIIQNFKFQIDNFQTSIEKMQNKDDTVSHALQALIETSSIDCLLQLSDEGDKKSISLMGVKSESLNSPKPQSFYNPAIKNQNETIQLDKTCLTCSSQSYKIISAFKMACLSYFPSSVIFKDQEFSREELISVKQELLQNIEEKLERSIKEKQNLGSNQFIKKGTVTITNKSDLNSYRKIISLSSSNALMSKTTLDDNLSQNKQQEKQNESFQNKPNQNEMNSSIQESKILLTNRGRITNRIQEKTAMLSFQQSQTEFNMSETNHSNLNLQKVDLNANLKQSFVDPISKQKTKRLSLNESAISTSNQPKIEKRLFKTQRYSQAENRYKDKQEKDKIDDNQIQKKKKNVQVQLLYDDIEKQQNTILLQGYGEDEEDLQDNKNETQRSPNTVYINDQANTRLIPKNENERTKEIIQSERNQSAQRKGVSTFRIHSFKMSAPNSPQNKSTLQVKKKSNQLRTSQNSNTKFNKTMFLND